MADVPEPDGQGADRARLDRALIRAHADGDLTRLVDLYARAADRARTAGDIDAACFYLTHAYVFALQAGDGRADALHAALKAEGRDE